MQTDTNAGWENFNRYYFHFPEIEFSIDLSKLGLPDNYLNEKRPAIAKAMQAMRALEAGAISNPDEGRMVGHYWLRNPALSPSEDIRLAIERTQADILAFAKRIHRGEIKGAGGKFRHLLLIGIGGSALGPQFVSHALSTPGKDKLSIAFLDNTDPDGIDRVLATLGRRLDRTLVLVISKSGGTKETRNGMLETQRAFKARSINFATQAVAITGEGSELDRLAVSEGWLQRFPMWDWVGGRTSVLSAVGLLPAALQGFKINQLLKGAEKCDRLTRRLELERNPAALLAVAWYFAGQGRGAKDMVILPYKDRLELVSRYLQQLIMESLGKELDLNNSRVNQGIAVYGNKGSTDQHAYIQQLRDGIDNFFATFIEVLRNRAELESFQVEPGVTTGDYLQGFLLGTRAALEENGKKSITITLPDLSAERLGSLIALYERAVGIYASLINVNAYHQPGVEAGKKAASKLINLKTLIKRYLANNRPQSFTAVEIANALEFPANSEAVFKLCESLAANDLCQREKSTNLFPKECRYLAPKE